MKKVPSPRLCFASGRGLKRAVVGCVCNFSVSLLFLNFLAFVSKKKRKLKICGASLSHQKIYKVDHRGKQLKSEDDFEVDIVHSKDNTRVPCRYDKCKYCYTYLSYSNTYSFQQTEIILWSPLPLSDMVNIKSL